MPPIRDFEKFRPGRQISAAELNRQARMVRGLSGSAASGMSAYQTNDVLMLSAPRPADFWAKFTTVAVDRWNRQQESELGFLRHAELVGNTAAAWEASDRRPIYPGMAYLFRPKGASYFFQQPYDLDLEGLCAIWGCEAQPSAWLVSWPVDPDPEVDPPFTGDLSPLNGAWLLLPDAGGWSARPWSLTHPTAGVYQLKAEFGDFSATYLAAEWECCGPNTLELDSQAGEGDAPETLTVQGVGPCACEGISGPRADLNLLSGLCIVPGEDLCCDLKQQIVKVRIPAEWILQTGCEPPAENCCRQFVEVNCCNDTWQGDCCPGDEEPLTEMPAVLYMTVTDVSGLQEWAIPCECLRDFSGPIYYFEGGMGPLSCRWVNGAMGTACGQNMGGFMTARNNAGADGWRISAILSGPAVGYTVNGPVVSCRPFHAILTGSRFSGLPVECGAQTAVEIHITEAPP